jgi:hypothetical protein
LEYFLYPRYFLTNDDDRDRRSVSMATLSTDVRRVPAGSLSMLTRRLTIHQLCDSPPLVMFIGPKR